MRTLLALAMLVMAVGARASEWGEVWDSVAAQPGAQVTDKTDPSGTVTREIMLPSKVIFILRRRGGRIESTGLDNSGHGAVGCSAQIIPRLLFSLDICAAGRYPDLRRAIEQEVNDIDDFITRNSLVPVTKEQLLRERSQARQALQEKSAGMSAEDIAKKCREGDLRNWLTKLEQGGEEGQKALAAETRKSAEDLLSVPRPPVLNPCL